MIVSTSAALFGIYLPAQVNVQALLPWYIFPVLIRLQEENILICKGWKLYNGIKKFVTFAFSTGMLNDYMSRFNLTFIQDET